MEKKCLKEHMLTVSFVNHSHIEGLTASDILGFFPLNVAECAYSPHHFNTHSVFACYSTALLNPKSERSSLQLVTGVKIVF